MPGPLVAVSAYHLPAGQVQRWRRGGYGLPETYVAGVRRAGGVPVLLPPGHPGAVGELLERFDGLLLAGGGDLDPARYGVPRHPATERVDAERDDLELGLARAAAERGLPTLGICRGM